MTFSKTSTFDGEFNSREKARIERKHRREAIRDKATQHITKAVIAIAFDKKPSREGLDAIIDGCYPFGETTHIGVRGYQSPTTQDEIMTIWNEEKAKVLDARFPDVSRERTQAAFDEVTRRKEEYVDKDGLTKSRHVGKFEPITLFGGGG
jgi:hypothetical protein